MAYSYWLVKSEPSVYSWEQLVKDKKITWDGVRNYQARNHLQQMKKGDWVLFYHSNEERAIVGIARVCKEAYQDPTTSIAQWVAVDIAHHQALTQPVYLADIKKQPALSDIGLIKQGRLSVMPLTDHAFKLILTLSKTLLHTA